MSNERTVTVYGYLPRLPLGTPHSWRHKAPREVIERFEAELIEGTAEEVPMSELDAQGLFCRVATGWGELPPH